MGLSIADQKDIYVDSMPLEWRRGLAIKNADHTTVAECSQFFALLEHAESLGKTT